MMRGEVLAQSAPVIGADGGLAVGEIACDALSKASECVKHVRKWERESQRRVEREKDA